MKYIITLSIAIMLLSCSTSDFENIEGEWIAEGYNCEDQTGLTEELKIEKDGKHILATKLTGDNCIKAGDTTWYGQIQKGKIIAKVKGMNPQTREM